MGFALLAADDEIDQRLRPRQAAGMGGEDAVGAGFHAGSGGDDFAADGSFIDAVLSLVSGY